MLRNRPVVFLVLFLLYAFPALASSIPLTAEEWLYLQRKGEITMCVDPDWYPVERVNSEGKYEGLAADHIRLMEQKLGVPFRLIPTETFAETMQMAREGKCDIIPALNTSANRQGYLDFTPPYIVAGTVIVTRSNEFFVRDVSELFGRTVALVKGYHLTEVLRRTYPQLQIILAASQEEAFRMVYMGQADATLTTPLIASYTIKRFNLSTLKISGSVNVDNLLQVGVRKGDAELLSIMTKVVESIDRQESNALYREWIASKFTEDAPAEVPDWWKFSPLVLLLLLPWLWGLYNLRRRTRELESAREELEACREMIEAMSDRDRLTRTFNRMKTDSILQAEIDRLNRSARSGARLSILLTDMDLFKGVNDRCGLQKTDEVLRKVADMLRISIRRMDSIGRWASDEFMIVCPETGAAGARGLAEKLRRCVDEYDFGEAGHLTLSVGVATCREGESADSLVARADLALYRAKESGRNRVAGD